MTPSARVLELEEQVDDLMDETKALKWAHENLERRLDELEQRIRAFEAGNVQDPTGMRGI